MEKIKGGYRKIIARFLLATIALVMVFTLVKKAIFLFGSTALTSLEAEKVKVNINSIHSDKIKESLIEFVSLSLNSKKKIGFKTETFYTDLKKNFKVIKDVEWDFTNPEQVQLKLKGANPFCKVNEQFILGDNKNLFSFDCFEKFDIDNLKSVFINPNLFMGRSHLGVGLFDQKISLQIYSFLKNVSQDVWEKYDLDYQDNFHITLCPKEKERKFLLLTDDKNIFDEQKLEWAEKIGELVGKRVARRGKRKYMCDLRFKNRIFIGPAQGGVLVTKNTGRG